MLRGRYPWRRTESGYQEGERTLWFENGAVSISYSEEADGRPKALHIRRITPDLFALGQWKGEDLPAPEMVLGEQCHWIRFSISGDYRDCLSTDGLPLRSFGSHWGLGADLTAVSLSRTEPSDDEILPPLRLFDWSPWLTP